MTDKDHPACAIGGETFLQMPDLRRLRRFDVRKACGFPVMSLFYFFEGCAFPGYAGKKVREQYEWFFS
ncbi:MAG: hypothetical protein AB1631_10850 [Acidobacteriota bacterium]